jgi:hypothetical protein
MASRQRTCLECSSQFSYAIRRGADRIYCGVICQDNAQARLAKARAASSEPCIAPECIRKRRSPGSDYCEVHYYRLRRTGLLDTPPPKRRYVDSRGYAELVAHAHPLARKRGRVGPAQKKN